MGDINHPLPSIFQQLNNNVTLYNNPKVNTSTSPLSTTSLSVHPNNTTSHTTSEIISSTPTTTTNSGTTTTPPTTINIVNSSSFTNKNNMKIPFNLNFDPIEIDNNSKSILKNYPSIQQLNNNNNINKNLNHFQTNQQSNNLTNTKNHINIYNLTSNNNNLNNLNNNQPQPKKEISKKIMKLDEKVYVPVRVCEFCSSSNTPTWRRGPSGKGSLCNACGIKWRLKGKDGVFKQQTPKAPRQPKQSHSHIQQQTQPQLQQPQQQIPLNKQQIQQHLQKLEHEQFIQQQKQIQKLQQQQIQQSSTSFQVQPQYTLPFSVQNSSNTKYINNNNSSSSNYNDLSHGVPQFEYSHIINPMTTINNNIKKRKFEKMELFEYNNNQDKGYYCKYCKKTWPQSSFRNSQQFGAHCSNCSRKPRDEMDALNKSILSKKKSLNLPSNQTGLADTTQIPQSLQNAPLLSRLIHVVENQLLDPTEMNSIREDIDEMKIDLIKRKKRRIDQLQNLSFKLSYDTQLMKQNIDSSFKSRELKTKEFIENLKNEVEKRLSQKELFYLPESIHTVPFSVSTKPNFTNITKKNSPLLLSSSKKSVVPLSPELIHSPHHSSVKFLDEKGKHFSIESMPIVQN